MILLTFVRSVVGGLLFLLMTALASVLVIFMILTRMRRSWIDQLICFWAEITVAMFGVRIREHGRRHLLKGGCLYLFNHTSFFDVFVMAARLPGMRFGAKSELFKIPFFGRAMKMAGVLPITRSNREKVFRVYDRAKVHAEQGQQYALSPEGGRNSVEKLLPFKAGPFIFAINSGLPITPVVILGAHEVLPKAGWLPNWKRWRKTIDLHYLPAVSVAGIALEQRSQLQKEVFAAMSPYFQTPDKES